MSLSCLARNTCCFRPREFLESSRKLKGPLQIALYHSYLAGQNVVSIFCVAASQLASDTMSEKITVNTAFGPAGQIVDGGNPRMVPKHGNIPFCWALRLKLDPTPRGHVYRPGGVRIGLSPSLVSWRRCLAVVPRGSPACWLFG